ncbi:ATP-dependent DNA ligase [Williamsia deligens]|uniref:DNA ligase (ATP) n=1 Tax=Williamsia deligens TaxID=321325 RepID=A0ABW3G9I0_9NOCA|nr:ATP-dependent DNA ligase [Williamsia deligens]MCP2193588.1 bifunctional non-homologous end joining protein LigD [Williamsia deligens]
MADTLDVDGRSVSVTHLDKVLYPATGTRKAEVIEYYDHVASLMLPHLWWRPVTRKRWPDGTGSQPFFEKNLPQGTPDWVTRRVIEHSDRSASYPLATSRADLIWFAQQAALELHVPQWTFPADDDGPLPKDQRRANRLVLDLDPGPGVPLTHTAEIALMVRDVLAGAGLTGYPVTSGSKGIHVYAPLPAAVTSDNARTVAKQIATALAAERPHDVTAVMSKAVRAGKVFIDWSQNSSAKTTLSPYSLRGRDEPMVAAPRTWDELEDPDLAHVTLSEMHSRVEDLGDLLADLDRAILSPDADPVQASTAEPGVVDLSEYRRKRDETRTPEPFGDSGDRAATDDTDDDASSPDDTPAGPIFVIQEHHARRLHYDFRLERNGVLVSWAVPKNLPVDPGQNRLAVHTEDHPMDYAGFAGDIPAGEYGGGHVEIWDRGTFETEKWRDDEVIVRLHGERIQGRYALIRTGDKNWLAHLMSDEPRPIVPDSLRDPHPMLATLEPVESLDAQTWAFEGKWDGYRILAQYTDGTLRLRSRSGIDMTADFPELGSLADDLGLLDVILDGEVVAIDSTGRSNFTLLASRGATEEPFEIRYLVFDVLFLNGTSLLRRPWHDRRAVLEEIAPLFARDPVVDVPPVLEGSGAEAMAHSRDRNWEGVVAKRRDSVYQQGRRSTTWRKQKNWQDVEVVVGGWRPGKGNRSSTIGSLLVGLPEETGLRYVGRVGTGLTDRQLAELTAELAPLRRKTSPFLDRLDRPIERDAVWVLPQVVAEVRFMDWTTAGHLRHPSWRGIRRDKLPGDL